MFLLAFTAIVAFASRVAPQRPIHSAPSPRRVAWLKRLAALRLLLCVVLAFALVLQLVDGLGHLPPSVRWPLWLLTGFGIVACLVNAIAGLWLLSPFTGADPGCEVRAAGLRGTIRGYGWFRLAVSTPAGWLAHVPYWSLLYRPLIVRREDGARTVVLIFRRELWSSDEVSHLRQAAILCPYRDPSCPVRISRRASSVAVRIGLAAGASEERVRGLLEHALARHSEAEVAPEPAGSALP
jgi:hypothetical protein